MVPTDVQELGRQPALVRSVGRSSLGQKQQFSNKIHGSRYLPAVDVTAENPLKFSQLELEISGAADVELPFTAEKLTSEISGASEVELEGECEYVDLKISGATEFSAMNFRVTNMNLELSGASDAKVHVTGELIVEASGRFQCFLQGEPESHG